MKEIGVQPTEHPLPKVVLSILDRITEVVEKGKPLKELGNILGSLRVRKLLPEDVYRFLKQTAILTAQKLSYLRLKEEELSNVTQELADLVGREASNKFNRFKSRIDELATSIDQFKVPAGGLAGRIAQVERQYARFLRQIETMRIDLDETAEAWRRAIESSRVPEPVKAVLREWIASVEKQKDRLSLLRREVEKNKQALIDYYAEQEKIRDIIAESEERIASLTVQERFHYMTRREYIKAVIEEYEKLNETLKKEQKQLEPTSQAFQSLTEQIRRNKEKLVSLRLELEQYSAKALKGAIIALIQFKDEMERTASRFAIAHSLMLASLNSLYNAFVAVFGDIMLGKLRSFADYFRLFVNAIIAEIAKLMARLVMLKTVIPILEKVFGKETIDKVLGRKSESTTKKILDVANAVAGVVRAKESGGGGFPTLPLPVPKTGGVLGKIGKVVAGIAGAIGIGKVLGGIFGGLFGGGKHHPGKYGWRIEWGGIHITPTGEVKVDIPNVYRIYRAGEPQNQLLRWKFSRAVSEYLTQLQRQISSLPLSVKRQLASQLEQINQHFRNVTFTTHLEALRQQAKAFETYMNQYYLKALKETYGRVVEKVSHGIAVVKPEEEIGSWERRVLEAKIRDLRNKLRKGIITPAMRAYFAQIGGAEHMNIHNLKRFIESYTGFTVRGWYEKYGRYESLPGLQKGGVVKGSTSGYLFTGILHGTEHIVPDKEVKELKKEIASLKEVIHLLLSAEADQIKYSKRSYELLLKWDISGLKVNS
ncbi:MAG: hypothetical protein DRP09_18110 [Candidatus Thorarchaeota archaeon]|nr:MAG: hypothetical protein DRP09_18110 [Candidatus Thorarchaeota archaeon]